MSKSASLLGLSVQLIEQMRKLSLDWSRKGRGMIKEKHKRILDDISARFPGGFPFRPCEGSLSCMPAGEVSAILVSVQISWRWFSLTKCRDRLEREKYDQLRNGYSSDN